jgi:hypothetical protein
MAWLLNEIVRQSDALKNGTGGERELRPVDSLCLQPDRLRVQAMLPDIRHDFGHAGGVRIVNDVNQMGLVETVAYRDHPVAMADVIFDSFQRGLVEGFVDMYEKVAGLHKALLAMGWDTLRGQ